jgi:hypothetical protein
VPRFERRACRHGRYQVEEQAHLAHGRRGRDRGVRRRELVFLSFTGDKLSAENKVAEVDLTGGREFTAGSIEQLPFEIVVPANLGPTTNHMYASVEWRVEVVLDRRMRGDLAVDTPLIVY